MQDHHALRNQLQDIDYGPAPSILLFSDDPHQRDWIASVVSTAGGRIAAVLDLADAVDRIAEQAAPDGVIADIGSAPELQAESILAALETGAQSYRFRSIALIARERIDLAVATAEHGDVQLLCEPDHNALASAIAGLLAPRDRSLNDVSTEARPIKLRELSEEVGRIARTLAALSQPDRRSRRQRTSDRCRGHPCHDPGTPPARPFLWRRTLSRPGMGHAAGSRGGAA